MKKYLIILLALALAGNLMAAPPEWFVSGKHKKYQTEWYLIGTGSAPTAAGAVQKGMERIAEQIETSIQAQTVSVIQSYMEDDQEHITQLFQQSAESVTKATLRGVETVEQANDGGTYYAYCVLEKERVVKGLKFDLDQLSAVIADLYEQSDKLINSGNIFAALETYMASDESATEFYTKAGLYNVFSSTPYPTKGIKTGAAIIGEVRAILKNIKMERGAGDKQSVKLGSLMPEPLTVKVTYEKSRNDVIPMANVRMRLRDHNEKPVDRQYTDDDGLVEFYASALDQKGRYTVGIDLSRVPRTFQNDVKDLTISFRYEIVTTAPMAFRVIVVDEKSKPVPDVQTIVAKSVSATGNSVSDGAPFELYGRMSLVEDHQIEGFDGPIFQAKTELSLQMRVAKSGEALGSITVTAIGQDKKNQKAAIDKSYKKLKVDKGDMARLLADAADKLGPMLEKFSKESFQRGKEFHRQNKNFEALVELSNVSDGDPAMIAEAQTLIDKIKGILQAEADARAQAEMEKERLRTRQAEAAAMKAQAQASADIQRMAVEAMRLEQDRMALIIADRNYRARVWAPSDLSLAWGLLELNLSSYNPNYTPEAMFFSPKGTVPYSLQGTWTYSVGGDPLIVLTLNDGWSASVVMPNYDIGGNHGVFVGNFDLVGSKLTVYLLGMNSPMVFKWTGSSVISSNGEKFVK